jgi:transposase
LRRADTLPDVDRARLEKLFEDHPCIGAGWHALQELYGLYPADDRAGALAALDRFCDLYATGELSEFRHVVDTIITWSEEILAYHDPAVGRASNGRLEGTNNKVQVLRRVAFGFTDHANFEARGILVCPAIRSSPPRPAALTP